MKTILLIEDNICILENFTEYLKLEGYTVLSTTNGKAGLKLAKKFIPDLIICDVLMPEMDGRIVLNSLKETPSTSNIPFIFSSSLSEEFDKTAALKSGANDYILKPFTFEVFLKTIKSCISKYRPTYENTLIIPHYSI